ncbi:MAG: hypothetical protein LBU32_04190 [Clostridiales bacterium]|nr:hypothetical protein [Clostridiales bacterium]
MSITRATGFGAHHAHDDCHMRLENGDGAALGEGSYIMDYTINKQERA